MLDAAGFTDVKLEPRREPMWFGHDASDAYELVSGLLAWMLEGLDDTSCAGALDALRATIAAHETPDGVLYESAVWIVSARRP